MADVIRLTEHWVSVTGLAEQELDQALDVLRYDMLYLQLVVAADVLSQSATAMTVALLSGMSCTGAGITWQTVATFPAVGTSNLRIQMSYVTPVTLNGGFFRYLRWQVTGWNGAFSAARFLIEGIGRSYH